MKRLEVIAYPEPRDDVRKILEEIFVRQRRVDRMAVADIVEKTDVLSLFSALILHAVESNAFSKIPTAIIYYGEFGWKNIDMKNFFHNHQRYAKYVLRGAAATFEFVRKSIEIGSEVDFDPSFFSAISFKDILSAAISHHKSLIVLNNSYVPPKPFLDYIEDIFYLSYCKGPVKINERGTSELSFDLNILVERLQKDIKKTSVSDLSGGNGNIVSIIGKDFVLLGIGKIIEREKIERIILLGKETESDGAYRRLTSTYAKSHGIEFLFRTDNGSVAPTDIKRTIFIVSEDIMDKFSVCAKNPNSIFLKICSS